MLRIKLLRLSRGMTQFGLSREAGVSTVRYSYLERGLLEATPAERDTLARVLDASAASLFREASGERKRSEEPVMNRACL